MVRKGLKKLFSPGSRSSAAAASKQIPSTEQQQQQQHSAPLRSTPQHQPQPQPTSQTDTSRNSSVESGASAGAGARAGAAANKPSLLTSAGGAVVRGHPSNVNRQESTGTARASNISGVSGRKVNGGAAAAGAVLPPVSGQLHRSTSCGDMDETEKGAAGSAAIRSAVQPRPMPAPPGRFEARSNSVPTDPTPPLTDLSRYRTTGHRPMQFGGSRRKQAGGKDKIFDDPAVVKAYDSIPVLEITKLPRGGLSMESKAVGRVQFGIPPETIKDSMRLGLEVPSVYVVPVERFCREMGPALGVNLAEFEFPAYFNFFVQRKRCTLIVDSDDAERNIRRVFSETLLGPAQFRREDDFITHEDEDFSPDFPVDAIPNFQKEFKHFRIMPDGKELVLETLLKFRHFQSPKEGGAHEGLGIPPKLDDDPAERTLRRKGRSGSFCGSMTSADVSSPSAKEEEKKNKSRPKGRRTSTGVTKSKEAALKRTSFVKTTDDLPGNAMAAGGDELVHVHEQYPIPNADAEKGSKPWQYSQAKWIGDVATVFPEDATPEQIANKTAKRVEIFKMPGGTEYILHDIDEKNIIVGKARFSGNVRVSEFMSVDGFGGRDFVDIIARRKSTDLVDGDDEKEEAEEKEEDKIPIPESVLPPTFHPPSFGVTVLGNSHGFDKSGSVSGYVLWINGRGVMIDPPPYSSATLEREGIRPRNIVGIILTHCHADHDAGAFQKVLTGTPVVVITTPTIYKSFIRKYAALSALSPALLRHSHRHKPAIVGTPLRFQGATFHFTYTLHTIPCVGFRVEWRGRSMVFTGDHFNNPPAMDKLEESGVLSKARADDLRSLPLQETDLLLHEAGAPPIHTPLDVLLKLPPRVKKRLYVVHTSALPEGCELRAAPTGTAGTIRLDQLNKNPPGTERKTNNLLQKRTSILEGVAYEDESILQSLWTASEYDSNSFYGESSEEDLQASFSSLRGSGNRKGVSSNRMSSLMKVQEPPLVSLRPTSSTDAWFILNLLSAVPFLSSLSYASTMEVLETARVDAFCMYDVVVPASRRRDVLCVVWEGTCMEREQTNKKEELNSISSRTGLLQQQQRNKSGDRRTSTFQINLGTHVPLTEKEVRGKKRIGAVWHAGDWTGPRSLQPDKRLSGESSMGKTHDIVAMSSQGVKVITVEFSNLHEILKSGSPLYRKYLARKAKLSHIDAIPETIENDNNRKLFENAVHNLNVIELIDCNSALRKLTAVQKRHLESLAEGPVFYHAGQRLWRAGAPVDRAFIVVAGTVSFVPRRRNAGSVKSTTNLIEEDDDSESSGHQLFASVGESMQKDALRAVKELGKSIGDDDLASSNSSLSSADIEKDTPGADELRLDSVFTPASDDEESGEGESIMMENNDYERLSRGLQRRADSVSVPTKHHRRDSSSTDASASVHDYTDSTIGDDHTEDNSFIAHGGVHRKDGFGLGKAKRRRSSRDRFANKVLGRLYSRRAFTAGLVFSRGHLLGDVSKMVAGLLSTTDGGEEARPDDDEMSAQYGFGEKTEGKANENPHGAPIGELVIHEKEGDQHIVHSSTLAAGKDGCVVMVFPKASLIPFLDEYPGLLLSLLGTQVVV